MTDIDTVFQDYVQYRQQGYEPAAILEHLRDAIALLTQEAQARLSRQIRRWEKHETAEATTTTPVEAVVEVEAAANAVSVSSGRKSASAANMQMIVCPQCARQNVRQEVFCFNCGGMLGKTGSAFETAVLDEDDAARATFFGADTMLVLVVRGTNKHIRLRPQERQHETVIGRSDGGMVLPDVDLAEHDAARYGLSRMHAALRWDERHEVLNAVDLKSANGTFVNGQRLLPNEARVLRHGDELRVARLVLQLYFQHPGD